MSKEVSELKKEIAKLTNRVPVSSDARYLTQRLATLKARKEEGEDVRHRASNHSVLSVSMPTPARSAVEKVLTKTKLGASKLVRDALVLWCQKNGHEKEAAIIADDPS